MDNILFKVVLLGDIAVGKTALLSQFAHKQFKENYKTTIGTDFTTREISIDSNIVTLQIWDTAGQERFRSLSTAFFRGTDVCLYVNNRSMKLLTWKEEFITQVGVESDFPFVMVGTKMDLENQRQVSGSKAEQVARELEVVANFETSAKTAQNVEKAFYCAANTALKRNTHRKPFLVPTNTVNVAPNINGNNRLPTSSSTGCC